MIYTDITKKAMNIAYNYHKDMVDKGGVPYIFHCFFVAEGMKDEKTKVVALLHDILEDTSVTAKELINEGIPKDIVDAVTCLARDKNVEYMDYIKNVNKNPLARQVKIRDLIHNSDLTRLSVVTEKDLIRVKKYKTALEILRCEDK
ncbi:MAG: GTP pyrophosphokinase [Tyzzerella sp.]|uniref:GTP pyrophosphokinase n=1 Tax=Candidatus Fimicola merdigallinarum TaxID=2840819 RepID=A0A9D9DVY3_9FIRM|nr:GTP pyrophosphokinase [Candidatus Fimicola merdigallinarum]